VFVFVAVVCGALLLVPLRLVRRHEWWAVLAWLIVGLWMQGVIRQETRYTLEQVFVSEGANSFYQPALHYDALRLLRDFDRLRPGLPPCPGTHARKSCS
jgi:hypothetical protein